jgi:hypothetical protein
MLTNCADSTRRPEEPRTVEIASILSIKQHCRTNGRGRDLHGHGGNHPGTICHLS